MSRALPSNMNRNIQLLLPDLETCRYKPAAVAVVSRLPGSSYLAYC
jgi:hypothetical protein